MLFRGKNKFWFLRIIKEIIWDEMQNFLMLQRCNFSSYFLQKQLNTLIF